MTLKAQSKKWIAITALLAVILPFQNCAQNQDTMVAQPSSASVNNRTPDADGYLPDDEYVPGETQLPAPQLPAPQWPSLPQLPIGGGNSGGSTGGGNNNGGGSTGTPSPLPPNTPVTTMPVINGPADVLVRNAACPSNFLGSAAKPSGAANVSIGNTSGKGFGSIYHSDVGTLRVVQLKFDNAPATLRVDNAAKLDGVVQVFAGIAVCIGAHEVSQGLTQNNARIITLVNRGTSRTVLPDVTQNSSPEIHLFGFKVNRITQLQQGSFTVLYDSSVGDITQNRGIVLVMKADSSVKTSLTQNGGLIEMREGANAGRITQNDGTISIAGDVDEIIQNMGTIRVKGNIKTLRSNISGTIEVDGGVVESLQGGSGTLILKNGATIRTQSGSSMTIVNK